MTSPYRGNQITAVNIGVNCEATNVSIYIKHSPKDDDYIYRQRLDKLEAGWNTIILDTPYEIGEQEDIAIGYKATFTSANGVGYSKDSYPDGDYVYVNSKSQWSSTNGSICIQAYVEGDNMPVDELMMGKINDYIVADYDSDSIVYTGSVRNMGVNTISSYSIICSLDGTDYCEKEFDTELAADDETTFTISVPATETGKHSVVMTINKVNGADDSYAPDNDVASTYIVRDQEFRRKVVCEEGTGTYTEDDDVWTIGATDRCIDGISDTTVVVDGLEPERTYTLTVKAVADEALMDSPESQPVTVVTPPIASVCDITHSDATVIGMYDIYGRVATHATQGLILIKHSDGAIVKTIR